MISTKVKVKNITNVCYGICIFLFVIGQSNLLPSFAILAMMSRVLKITAAIIPLLVLFRSSKFSVRNLILWALIALLIIGNIFLNQADSDLAYIVIFILYCSKAEPESILKTYYISAGTAIMLVICAWLAGIIPAQSSGGREYLGFYFATFGPNLFLHTVLAYVASKKSKIKLRNWILIEIINIWFYKMTDTLAVFIIVSACIVLYYLFSIERIKQFLFNRGLPKRILETFPFISAIATIIAQYYYIAHYNEPMFVVINAVLSNRPYLGKIALETYGVSLFGQPITWLTGTDGTRVSGIDYFYVDSSYLQVLVRYGVVMLVILCFAMMAVQCYSVSSKNIYMNLGCSLFLVHCITDPQLLSFRYNPFIIISVACFGMLKHKKSSLKRKRNEEEYEQLCRSNCDI